MDHSLSLRLNEELQAAELWLLGARRCSCQEGDVAAMRVQASRPATPTAGRDDMMCEDGP